MTVMVRTERDFTPICEFRCKWCLEPAVDWVETNTHGYGTPLCGICSTLNEQLFELHLTTLRARRLLLDSPLPQVDDVVRHKGAPWRGSGRVKAVFGRLVEVVWTHGYTMHHHDQDLERVGLWGQLS